MNKQKNFCKKCGKKLVLVPEHFNEETGNQYKLCPTQMPVKVGQYLNGHSFYEGE